MRTTLLGMFIVFIFVFMLNANGFFSSPTTSRKRKNSVVVISSDSSDVLVLPSFSTSLYPNIVYFPGK